MAFNKEDRNLIIKRLAFQIPKGYSWDYSIYNPGGSRRYQLELWKEKALFMTFPRNYHLPAKEFKAYCDGLLEAFENPLNLD